MFRSCPRLLTCCGLLDSQAQANTGQANTGLAIRYKKLLKTNSDQYAGALMSVYTSCFFMKGIKLEVYTIKNIKIKCPSYPYLYNPESC